jgi:hypothetical protein
MARECEEKRRQGRAAQTFGGAMRQPAPGDVR